MTTEDPQIVRDMLKHISNSPDLLDLLYDMGFMPEQLERGSADWSRMLMLAERHQKLWAKKP